VFAGAISIALALYLWLAATHALRVAQLTSVLPRVAVRDLLRPGMLIPHDVSVGEALRRAWETQARGLVLIDSTQRPLAIVDEARIGAVPPEQRAWTPVSAVARPLEPGMVIPDTVDAEQLLRRMQATPAPEYLMVRPDGSPAGIIATRDFALSLRNV
jgi:hypothetical protein